MNKTSLAFIPAQLKLISMKEKNIAVVRRESWLIVRLDVFMLTLKLVLLLCRILAKASNGSQDHLQVLPLLSRWPEER